MVGLEEVADDKIETFTAGDTVANFSRTDRGTCSES